MPTARCAFCGHDNPEASNFCNECGAALHLTLCTQCDAVNDLKATQCHKCGAPLPTPVQAEADLPATAETAFLAESVEAPESSSHKHSWRPTAVITLLLVVIASGAVYSIMRMGDSTPIAQPPSAATVEPKTLPAADVQSIDRAAAESVGPTDPHTSADNTGPPTLPPGSDSVAQGNAEAPSEIPNAAKRESGAEQEITSPSRSASSSGRPPVERPVDRRPRHDTKHDAGRPVAALIPARPEANSSLQTPRNCTDGIAALGLCSRSRDESR